MRHKILIIKLAALGDIASTSRAVAEVFGALPKDSEIHWVLDAGYHKLAQSMTSILGCDGIQFHAFNTERLFRGSVPNKLVATAGLLSKCKAIGPSAIVLLHRDFRYKLALRAVFRVPIFGLHLSIENEYDMYFDALSRLRSHYFSAHTPITNISEFQQFKKGHVGILVGGAANTKGTFFEKRWPHLKNFIEKLVLKQNFKISLFGGKEDVSLANEILASETLRNANCSVENFVGLLDLDQIPNALQSLQYFVSIDSGLGHIAAAVMTAPEQKVISLFGPTDPRIWAPKPRTPNQMNIVYRGISCSPCYKNSGLFSPCPYTGENFQRCMKEISPDHILDLIT
ncbi:MAG TPA: glycosyltransferase family 9 protein [Oligoflexia bacterium]|nr:glycosyltransferase family 9 protein [Oligoflexia bacterium]